MHHHSPKLLLFALVVLAYAVGCNRTGGGGATDGGGDGDADGDTDSDADTDSDTDSGSDPGESCDLDLVFARRDDGTAPTASVGMPLAVGVPLQYDGDLTGIKFIEQAASAKLNISYYY